MIQNFCQADDVGMPIVYQFLRATNGLPFNIATADTLQIIIGLPNGVKFTKTATLYTDGLDGKIYYLSEAGDLPVSGIYSIQGKVVIGSTTLYGSIVELEVMDNVTGPNAPPTPAPHVGTFTNSDLVSNILTIYHYEDLAAPYPVEVAIFDNNGHQIVPDAIIGSSNSVQIDLTSFAPITGTWGYVYT